MNPFFSVVIPLYNKRPHILRSVNSVLGQEFKDFELIVVDDGSTDGSVNELLNINDKRLKIISKENGGVSSARNRGIEESIGEYIAFLDADDEWEKDFLSTIISLIHRFPNAGIYTTAYKNKTEEQDLEVIDFGFVNFEGIIQNYFNLIAQSGRSVNNSSNSVIKKDLLNSSKLFDEQMRHYEDHLVWYTIALKYPVVYSSKVGANIYKDAQNRSSAFGGLQAMVSSALILINTLVDEINQHHCDQKCKELKNLLFRRQIFIYKQLIKREEFELIKKLYYNSLFNSIGTYFLSRLIVIKILNRFLRMFQHES
jgi:glycosyltransferase involved in cell wall biosynthesis